MCIHFVDLIFNVQRLATIASIYTNKALAVTSMDIETGVLPFSNVRQAPSSIFVGTIPCMQSIWH